MALIISDAGALAIYVPIIGHLRYTEFLRDVKFMDFALSLLSVNFNPQKEAVV